MSVATVSPRYDGEVPNAEALNELLVELQALLVANGLPSNLLQWPVVAQNVLDMNGFAIVNAASTSGVVHVNEAMSLTSALATLPTGGTIEIDPGFAATTSSSGIAVAADNITIRSSGGGSILVASRGASGPGILVTGDDFRLEDVTITCEGSLTNVTALVETQGASRSRVTRCFFDTPQAVGVLSTFGVSGSYGGVVSGNVMSSGSAAYVEIQSAYAMSVDNNYMTSNSAENILITNSSALLENISIKNNIAVAGTYAVHYAHTIFDAGVKVLNIIGNTFLNQTSGFDTNAFAYVKVADNTFSCDCVLSNHFGEVVGNTFLLDIELTDSFDVTIVGNTFVGTLTLGSGNSMASMSSNIFEEDLNFFGLGSEEIAGFTGNTSNAIFVSLAQSSVEAFTGNYATGGTT